MSKIFVMGDIHGAYKALVQVLERSGFNKEEDTLIQLGDVADGWSEVYECVEELLTIKNLISIKGNHDDWLLDYILYGFHPSSFQQGGDGTRNSYNKHLGIGNIPQHHRDFFNTQKLYYIDNNNRCFVHGGFNRHELLENQYMRHAYYWDRDLWMSALSFEATKRGNEEVFGEEDKDLKFKTKNNFKEIFIGHTSTTNWKTDKPMKAANIWNLDTGAGFSGKLTIMNVDTHEYYQSDNVKDLYKDEKGRN